MEIKEVTIPGVDTKGATIGETTGIGEANIKRVKRMERLMNRKAITLLGRGANY